MKEKCERVDDVVAELRRRAELRRKSRKLLTIDDTAIDLLADRIEAANKRLKEEILGFCNVFTLVYPPDDKDCPVILMGAFLNMCDALGIEQVKIGGK